MAARCKAIDNTEQIVIVVLDVFASVRMFPLCLRAAFRRSSAVASAELGRAAAAAAAA